MLIHVILPTQALVLTHNTISIQSRKKYCFWRNGDARFRRSAYDWARKIHRITTHWSVFRADRRILANIVVNTIWKSCWFGSDLICFPMEIDGVSLSMISIFWLWYVANAMYPSSMQWCIDTYCIHLYDKIYNSIYGVLSSKDAASYIIQGY